MSVSEIDLSDDFDWSAGFGCMSCGMASVDHEVADSHQLTRGFFDHNPSSIVGDWENTLFRSDSLSWIYLEVVCNFLGMYTISVSKPLLGSGRVILRSLTSTGLIFKTSPMRIRPLGHKLQHDSVAWIFRFVNNFINQVFFDDFPLLRALFSEYLSQDRRVAGVFDLKVDSVTNVIEKGFEAGETVTLSGLRVAILLVGSERIGFIRGDGFQKSRSTEFVVEAEQTKILNIKCIFSIRLKLWYF